MGLAIAKKLKNFIFGDIGFGAPFFERARSKLGPLELHEIYGFEPAIVLGGKVLLENLAKVNAKVHLTILRQFADPELPLSGIDIEKLLNS